MMLDITKAYLGNIQGGDLFYNVDTTTLIKVNRIEEKDNNVVIYFDNDDKHIYKLNKCVDESHYKIFREII